MAKKPSGLGRGLDDLLEDNVMTLRESKGKPLVESKGEVKTQTPTSVSSLYGSVQKSLYDTKPRTRSVKSNFKK